MSRFRFLTCGLFGFATIFGSHAGVGQEAAEAQVVVEESAQEEKTGEESDVKDRPAEESDAEEPAASSTRPARDSVVKVYSIRRSYSLSSPWKRTNSSQVTGSGFVLSPTQILTNYHVVAMATDVSISLDGRSDRLSGRVKAIAPGLDIAMVELEEPLPDEVPSLPVADRTPQPGSKIQVLGYPKGGDTLSITEGVISRLEHVAYKYHTFGLRTQIDAPLNNGNSGGPMVADGQVIGIAFSGLAASNDIGYAIPCEEINGMLEDIQDGSYDGKPQLWINTQTLASKELRRWLKMPSDATGVRFSRMPIPVEDYPLQPNDVITHVGSYDVNNMGKVNLNENTQVSYLYAVDQLSKDGKTPLKILRDGQPMEIEVPCFRGHHYLLDYLTDQPPTYFVYGPIVLGVATADLFSSFDAAIAGGGNTAVTVNRIMAAMHGTENPLFMRRYDRVVDKSEELVVVSKLISNRMTRDIRVGLPAVIRSINGAPIKSIRQAAELLSSLEEDLLVIVFEDNRDTTIVLDRKQIESNHDEIMEENGIVNSASKNLRDVWQR